MAKHKPLMVNQDVTGVNLQGEAVTLKTSAPAQLSLFQNFFGEVTENKSNTIELYDAIPMHTYSRSIKGLRVHDQYLPIINGDFKHNGYKYEYDLKPARIQQADKTELEFYPSEREEFVEQALRKLAADQTQGLYLDGLAGVQFYLNELKAELANMGHDMNYDSIIQALEVGNSSHLKVTKHGSKKPMVSAPIFPVLLKSSREEWEKDPENSKWYVQFNPLVSACLKETSFRQFNYITNSKVKSILGRWFHKRLSHNYTQASLTKPYRIFASTILSDANVQVKTLRRGIQKIDGVLDDFRENDILLLVHKNPQYDYSENGQKCLIDVEYVLTPHPTFTGDVVDANKRKQVLNSTRKG